MSSHDRSRQVRVLANAGLLFVRDVSPHDASTIGRHWNAIRRYLETGYIDDLAHFDDVEIVGTDDGGHTNLVRLEADLDVIDGHAWRGDVSFESIYDEVQ